MRIIFIILTLFFLFFGVSSVFAEFSFTVPKTTISSDEEIEATITLSLQGQNNKTYYLEGAFKKEGATNYFGLTWNDSSWNPYTSSNFTTLKSIATDETGGWNGVVKVKIDEESSLFSGGGTYILRMKRFTTGGSGSWADNDIALTVSSLPTPTPTPTPTPSPSPTSKPSATSTPTPTPKKSSTPNPTSVPSLKPSPTNSPTVTSSPTKSTFNQVAVAGVSKSATSSTSSAASPSANIKVASQKQINLFVLMGIIFIIGGVGSLGYIFLRKNETVTKYFRKRN